MTGRLPRRTAMLLMLGGVAVLRVGAAADAPDPALLEFLGSVDSDDQNWREYLAQAKVPARPPGTPTPSTAAPANPPASAAPANAAGKASAPGSSAPPSPPATPSSPTPAAAPAAKQSPQAP